MRNIAQLAPSRRPVLVFADDFDAAPPAPPPEPVRREPAPPELLYTRAEMDEARADGFREGRTRLLAEDELARRRSALDHVAKTLREGRAEIDAEAERIAEELAGLLLAALKALLPEYCRAHGAAEACAVLRMVLPGLSRQPRAALRANEETIASLRAELAGLEPEASEMLTLISSGTMVDGDVRITWHLGSARREAAAIWRDIEAALGLSGLAVPQPTARAAAAITKEIIDA